VTANYILPTAVNPCTYQCTQCKHCLLFQGDRRTSADDLGRCKQQYQRTCHSRRQADTLCWVGRRLHRPRSPRCTDTPQRYRTAKDFPVCQQDTHIVLGAPARGTPPPCHTDCLARTYKDSSSCHWYRPCHRHSPHPPYTPLCRREREQNKGQWVIIIIVYVTAGRVTRQCLPCAQAS
jgi:hypothetical protein